MIDQANIDAEVNRVLEHLQYKVREKGFSQVKVQAEVGWTGSYLSQLFHKVKRLRVDHVLMILAVIDYSPGDFFRDLYASRTEGEQFTQRAWFHLRSIYELLLENQRSDVLD